MRPVFGVLAAFIAAVALAKTPKHVIIILADDLGHADLEWMSTPVGQIKTPNLKKLRENGVQLTNYHVQQVCSPSRAALMTGRYPIRYGMQHYVIPHTGTWGVPVDEVFLPKLLKGAAGFKTAHTGKHHMGMAKWRYTPTFRGFDSYLGYYGGGCTYFGCYSGGVYDMHRDMRPECGPGCSEVAWDLDKRYSTFIFTDRAVEVIGETDPAADRLFMYVAYQAVHSPDQVPQSYIDPYNETIKDSKRRTFAGMLSCMDEGVGNITRALEARGMLNDTLILFSTDNGGPIMVPDCDICGDHTGAVNWPLRGGKHSLWQGGVLGTGFLSGAGIPASRRNGTYDGLMHIADWLPTLAYGALGLSPSDVPTKPLDGVDVWQSIVTDGASPRDHYLLNIDRLHQNGGHAGYQRGDWKLLVGRSGPPDTWMAPFTDEPAAPGSRLGALLASARRTQRGADLDAASGACYLKTSKADREPGDCDSGAAPSGGQCSEDAGYCYPGHDLVPGGISGKTFAECCALCGQHSGCEYFTVNDKPGPAPSGWYNTTVQLFNMASDPYEHHDVAADNAPIVAELLTALHAINQTVVPPAHDDPNCPPFKPAEHNYSYVPWCGMGDE